ncbi:hypothetical protein [Blastococcus sp. SYSU DS0619]
MEHTADEQPAPRERIGSRAWVRTVGLVGGGLLAGGILAGTVSATAAEGTTTPEVTQEQGTTSAEDCPEGGARGDAGTLPGSGTDEATPESSTESTDVGSAA